MPRVFNFAVCLFAAISVTFASATRADANDELPTSFWPDNIEFDDSIPTPKEFFGFDIGFRHLTHAQVAGYVDLLAESSDRITIETYAKTHGGRPLLLLTITSQKNRKRLGQIKKAHLELSKSNSAGIDITDLPAVINMGYGVHGDEPSATNCAPLVAYYLAAAQGTEIEKWLDNCVILLDPSLNPDGFNRFANWANRYRGRVLNSDPQHAEHHQMWPPGRVNYYWFDLNRDWLPLVHPESRGRMNWYHKWKPNVVLDFHEMGTNSTFFFQPGIPERTNPLTPKRNQELTRKFGSYHAKALDERGSLYFTQERFDDFYMGKGSTYPDLHGSVGILFEQASSRGHVQKNQNGILRFHDTIANQFTTSLSSLRATSAMRRELLNFKRRFYQQALKTASEQKVQSYIFTCANNRTRIEEFAKTLKRHDIECYWLKDDYQDGDSTFHSNFSLVVPAQQPEYRFLRSLLMRQTDFQENIFYDVSSWTLPLAYGLQQYGLKRRIAMKNLEPVTIKSTEVKTKLSFSKDDIAYLIDYRDDQAPNVLAKLLSAGIQVRVAKKPFLAKTGDESKSFGYGTLSVVLSTQKQKTKTIRRILQLGSQRGAKIIAVKTGLSLSGPDLGSSNFQVIKKPNIAMLIGGRTSPYGAGQVWHVLDTQVHLPVTMIKSDRFSRTSLSNYTTLVLAEGRLDSEQWGKIKSFADDGGTVIAIGSLAKTVESMLRDETEDSASNQRGYRNPEVLSRQSSRVGEEGKLTNSAPKNSIQKPFDSAANERALKLISGAIFKTRTDLTHPLLYGFENEFLPVFRSHATFLTPSKNRYCNPLIYDSRAPLMAGYCSSENVEKFKGSASVVVHQSNQGQFILMADNPNFRGFWKATSRVFLNAVYFGDQVKP
ncbi:MAG: M14 family metallopeptidase [Mariniblastus sp.]|nr:M14 family metallopeptidase [Mariniblastus sp.]